MAPRAPGVHTHEEWKGMAQPVGLVVEPVVLNRLGVFPESATTVLADWQQRLEQLLEDQPVGEQWLSVAPSFELFCQEVLAWQPGDLRKPEELAAPVAVHLDDYDEVLRPDWVVPEPSKGDGPLKAQLLVQELPLGALFDALPNGADGRRSWEATPQQRLERLLKESEHPIGLLWNGVALRMVYAPRGESSGHLTFPLEPMTTVDGRPMLAALQMLLGTDRLFEGGASNTRLRPLMEQSRKEQNEVSTRLAEQVLEALWILLRGFDAAGLRVDDHSHIYGGLITVLLRLVFLLYAEDEELMPTDSLYGQHYSVGGLAQRLRQDRADYQNAMEGRRGAWATLLSLFRLVYDGGGSTEAYLPARHGDLFDPDAYPFLEGRTADTSYTDGPLASVPAISDDVVEQVLTKLLLLDGQILSYRALDVEQIGSVYEGIMGFMVEKATGPSVGITYRPPRQKITITVVVDADQLLAQPASKRDSWLKDSTGVDLKLPAKVSKGLKEASTVNELNDILDKRLSNHTPRGGFQPGSLILQPTAERRRSGSHYTPRALTEPIVVEAFRPWLERCGGHPTAEQVLDLKVCDPAMGSGAFLVAVCRYLAGWLVEAWEDTNGPGFPPEFKAEWDKDLYARRLIAQRCLYGVDKNPFAVNLAKLSLWLVTLSEHLPFTFVDHALKCGDSLVGYGVQEIQSAMKEVQLGFLNEQNQVFAQMGVARRESFGDDSLNDEGYDRKKVLLQQQVKASDGLRQAGDLMVAAFFDAAKAKDRADKQQMYLAMLSGAFNDEGLQDSIQEIRDRLAAGDKGITPFHWDLEFPEVFSKERGGFDAFVGNPPFVAGRKMKEALGETFQNWLQDVFPASSANADLSAFFFLRLFNMLQPSGLLGLIATNTIAQGDTRGTGLQWISLNGGTIYSARKRYKWPGVAAVVVSLVHLVKGTYGGKKKLDGQLVPWISAFLLANGGHEDPLPLLENAGKSFQGSVVLGMGFTFDRSGQADEDTVGIPSPITTMDRLIAANSKNAEVIFPFVGGEDVNDNPTHSHHRYVIDFRDRNEEECWRDWPQLMKILEKKVKPQRQELKANGEFKQRSPLPQKWWIHADKRPALYAAISGCQRVLVTSAAAVSHHMINSVAARHVFSHKLIVFPEASAGRHMCMQSLFHEEWSRMFGTTQGSADALTYNPTKVFLGFPFPSQGKLVCDLSKEFSNKRGILLEKMGFGPTAAYGSLHQPSEAGLDISAFRDLHDCANKAVAYAYGWSDLSTSCGFGLDYLDLEDDIQLPDGLQERIDDCNLFFWDAGDALDFQGQLQAYGAITGRRKLPWRYRWPDVVRDDVLARLLALNAERYAEEVAMGLHSKGAKKAFKAKSNGRTKKTGSGSSEFQLTSEPYQAGLKLF